MFEPLPVTFDFPAAERGVLEFWERARVFERSLEQRAGAPRFVFYEGPPTANGLPHPGHCLTRAMKDLFPRYQAMRGRLVERKGGWDTHGLPVEVEVCKELSAELGRSVHTKQEIEGYGVERFVHRCIRSVWRYTREWEEMTRRLGFWVNLDDAYATYHQSYVESVWWSLKTLFQRGLLYQGHKVVWWWCQGGTALSAGEVGEGYRTIDDPSVYVKFPLVRDEGTGDGPPQRTSLLVWTTTPWTLISNHFAAVHPELEYARVEDPGSEGAQPEYLYIAKDLVESVAKKVKRKLRVVSTCKGSELVGLHYLPPFRDAYYDRPWASFGDHSVSGSRAGEMLGRANDAAPITHMVKASLRTGGAESVGWRVLAADFVTLESGTGLVHEAPAFGEVDFNLLQDERQRFTGPDAIPLLCAVNPDGTFNDDAPERYRGRLIFECDREIIRELRDERKTPWGTPLLYHEELYRHEYPFCPRAEDDKLIQYARKSWFVRTSRFKEEFLANNAAVNWLPEHIREGRFGDFLRNNVDWALSRERYWGTPLPIWVCERCGKMEAVGSFDELRGRPGATDGGFWDEKVAEHRAAGDPELPADLRVHKPYIDAWTYSSTHPDPRPRPKSPMCTGTMRRVPEVIDCWWDAGSMPFAQWGYPHRPGSTETLAARFPADFISEAIDQTRGWFYGLLAISTLLFGPDDGTARPAADGEHSAAAGLPSEATMRAAYPHPFRTCIVLGHMMGEDGLKMSKRTKNYREPSYIFDHYGADAMRWYFFSAQTPWTTTRFVEASIRDAQREFLVKLYNVLRFLTVYAAIDGFDPSRAGGAGAADGFEVRGRAAGAAGADAPPRPMGWRPTAERSELDRWIISELRGTVRDVRAAMDRFENFPAAQRLNDFVDALSNWYVRRSRERFWRSFEDPSSAARGAAEQTAADQAKWDAYHTLYGCLRVLSRLIAPFTPFFAETMHRHLRVPGDPDSVHLCDYPTPEEIGYEDEALAAEMALVRQIVSTGRAARTAARLKVRQPLARVEIILARREHEDWLRAHADLIADELNVKQVEFATEAEHYVTYQIKPDFKAVGPKFGKLAPRIASQLQRLDPAAARRSLCETGGLTLEVDGQPVRLSAEELELRLEARPGWSAAEGRAGVVVVSTELTAELREEGLVRELVHHVQGLRKERDLPYEARVTLHLSADAALRGLIERHAETVRRECLAERLEFHAGPGAALREFALEQHRVFLGIESAPGRAGG